MLLPRAEFETDAIKRLIGAVAEGYALAGLAARWHEEQSRSGIDDFELTYRVQGFYDRSDTEIDLYRMRNDKLGVLQNDLLDLIQTRVVAPLVPVSAVDRVMHSLNPTVMLGQESYIFMPPLMATLTVAEMGEKVGSLGMMRDPIERALDVLLSGI